MRRFDQRQGFLVSAAIHLALLTMLILHPPIGRHSTSVDPATLERNPRVFLPPATVLRRLVPLAPRAAVPRPAATPVPVVPVPTAPPQVAKKDRISVGPPSDLHAKGPMILRRDDDLTKVAKGTPQARPALPAPAPAAPTPAPPQTARVDERPGREGLKLPPGLLGQGVSGEEGQRKLAGPTPTGTSLDRALEREVDQLARRQQRNAQLGIPTGTGQNLGGLYFDAQGADFTQWVQRFKDEVYRNWIVPQAALWGAARGHVDFEFTVERNGTVSSLRLLKTSGTASLDRAAQNALTSSRYLPLPADYGPPRLTIQVSFYYGESPRES
ncbi:MAG TPA: energy transducer TonB [Vicinamibacteria bacterium]|nr:energy transducer TonB [Vicinamibacteria bacterium]